MCVKSVESGAAVVVIGLLATVETGLGIVETGLGIIATGLFVDSETIMLGIVSTGLGTSSIDNGDGPAFVPGSGIDSI